MRRSNGLMAATTTGLAVLAALSAAAQGRPDVRELACGQARSLIKDSGAVVLTTGRYTFDRYVSNGHYCASGYITRRAYVQTRDAQSCFIGYRCVLDSRDDRLKLFPQ